MKNKYCDLSLKIFFVNKITDGSSRRGYSIIMDGISSRTARIDGREDYNIQQGHQKQQQEFTTRKLRNSSRDNRNITASTTEGRPATARKPEIVETRQQQ
jgi:hypothetical protein